MLMAVKISYHLQFGRVHVTWADGNQYPDAWFVNVTRDIVVSSEDTVVVLNWQDITIHNRSTSNSQISGIATENELQTYSLEQSYHQSWKCWLSHVMCPLRLKTWRTMHITRFGLRGIHEFTGGSPSWLTKHKHKTIQIHLPPQISSTNVAMNQTNQWNNHHVWKRKIIVFLHDGEISIYGDSEYGSSHCIPGLADLPTNPHQRWWIRGRCSSSESHCQVVPPSCQLAQNGGRMGSCG
jgi:hypothetical protein